jgi:hypothetical protein
MFAIAVASDEKLAEASKSQTHASTQLFMSQSAPTTTTSNDQDRLLTPQLHFQLKSMLVPQATLELTKRTEPDLKSDDLSKDAISQNIPPTIQVPKEEVVDVADGACDPRTGCLAKETIVPREFVVVISLVLKKLFEFHILHLLFSATQSCPGQCHKYQAQGFCLPSGACRCSIGWKGDDCNTAICDAIGGCSDHGICTSPNKCSCFPGFNGLNCAMYFVSIFHTNDVVTRSNASSLRIERSLRQNYTAVLNLKYNVINSTLNVTKAPVVPHPVSSFHPHKRTIQPSEQSEVVVKGSFIAIPAAPDFDFDSNSPFTITLWFKATRITVDNGGAMLTHGQHRHGTGYGVGMLSGGQIYCGVGVLDSPFRPSQLAVAVTRATFTDEMYHHIACRFDPVAKILVLLIDGNEAPLAQPFPYTGGEITYAGELNFAKLLSPDPSANDYPLVIGAGYDFQSDHFDGEIAEVQFWKKIVKFDVIRRGMWAPLSVIPPGLSFYLPLNDCANNQIIALRRVSDVQQAVLFPNTVTECGIRFHPIAKPPAEDVPFELL